MNAPVSILTPTVKPTPSSKARITRYLDTCYNRLGFAVRGEAAKKQLESRAANFSDELMAELAAQEPALKRRIR